MTSEKPGLTSRMDVGEKDKDFLQNMEHFVSLHSNVPQASKIATLPRVCAKVLDRLSNIVSSLVRGREV